MWRQGVWGSIGVGFALIIGCVPPQDGASGGGSKYPSRGEKFKGDIEFTLWNHTKFDIDSLEIQAPADTTKGRYASPETDTLISSNNASTPKMPPNAQQKWSLKPGKYTITAKGPGAAKYSIMQPLYRYELDLQAPTELVVYDDPAPPKDVAPPAGVKQILEFSWQEDSNRKQAEHNAAVSAQRDQEYAFCKKNIPPPNETPAPGKTKPDGKWTCVMSGGAQGTNYITIVQLAGGKITGTLGPGSADRNNSWEGAMVNDEVHFRWTGLEGGGKLKLDPGGRAMSGPAWTWFQEGRCNTYKMTCTR